MSGRLVVSLLVGLAVAAVIHLLLDGSLVPERGTAAAVIAGLTGAAVAVGLYMLLDRRASAT